MEQRDCPFIIKYKLVVFSHAKFSLFPTHSFPCDGHARLPAQSSPPSSRALLLLLPSLLPSSLPPEMKKPSPSSATSSRTLSPPTSVRLSPGLFFLQPHLSTSPWSTLANLLLRRCEHLFLLPASLFLTADTDRHPQQPPQGQMCPLP